MTRAEAIKAYREARDEADMILVGFILANPGTNVAGLCKEADPDNWKALESRVIRRMKKARSEGGNGITSAEPTPNQRASIRSAKSSLRKHPELAGELLSDPEVREMVTASLADYKAADAAAREFVEPMTKWVDQAKVDATAVHLRELAERIHEADTINADLADLDDAVVEYQLARSGLREEVAQ